MIHKARSLVSRIARGGVAAGTLVVAAPAGAQSPDALDDVEALAAVVMPARVTPSGDVTVRSVDACVSDTEVVLGWAYGPAGWTKGAAEPIDAGIMAPRPDGGWQIAFRAPEVPGDYEFQAFCLDSDGVPVIADDPPPPGSGDPPPDEPPLGSGDPPPDEPLAEAPPIEDPSPEVRPPDDPVGGALQDPPSGATGVYGPIGFAVGDGVVASGGPAGGSTSAGVSGLGSGPGSGSAPMPAPPARAVPGRPTYTG